MTDLPLTDANDQPRGAFPSDSDPGTEIVDAMDPAEPLVFYRALRGGMAEAGNVLRVVKSSGSVVLKQ